ncbi:ParB/RepB/Spo0J family partition protein [Fructilactobacillus fructivorans]|uniref:Chromosome (Plasmid) partitioning protein ParB n=1 Tax=Fructilactobacillus fructivorans TaxID=1614 RepID=A0A0C1PZI5_9LACO|nr:ParB/RepB/Spo0J family partition protein [Fructilactobacillus fructivorans]KID41083.1 Chromosome (plasmid) partitioning protein ParB [Fructilactobacillus fructivorans]KRK57418.1 Spo0J-like protein [Fructilactobacillus fructivorans]MCT0151454.1 ParB/RepB/Spo0J family partition protein [Fructilactobacillus fructivorans]MCT2866973.1 ParB/RepB/Spo0J family partition protein [Fructilactobacillus fructivorans]MCT2869274.1 ParB/RepB/Spo0J family partition protein [Fructilactobacillus fructivorans]
MTNKNSKGLGRGIEALFKDNDVNNDDEAVVDLDLTKISPNPYQPRKKFDQKALDDLTKSIEESGVFQPIIVRHDTDKNRYQIIAGERRFRASKAAAKTKIPAIVRDATEEQMMEIAVMENLQREDLNPLEEAQAYDTLMTKLNLTQAQVSERLGKSRPYIANYLRLLGLPQPVKEMLQRKQLSMGQARALLSVKEKSQLLSLAAKAKDETLTVRQLEKLIAKANKSNSTKNKRPTKRTKSPYIKESEDQLQDKFGTKVLINETNTKAGKGQIQIDYMSTDDLNRILDLLDIHLD